MTNLEGLAEPATLEPAVILAADDLTWYQVVLTLAAAGSFAVGTFTLATGVVDLLTPWLRSGIAGVFGVAPKRQERGYLDTDADHREQGRERIRRGVILAVPGLALLIVIVILF